MTKKKKPNPDSICDLVVRRIPRNIKNYFSAWCRLRERTMRDVLLECMKEKIKETRL